MRARLGTRAPFGTALLVAVVAVSALAACGDDKAGSGSAPDVDGTEWVSSDVVGHQLVEGTEIRLAFADETISANAGCNTMSGGYAFDGSTMQVDVLAMTEMGCEPALTDQDAFLQGFLTSAPTVELDGDTLTMTSGEEAVTMIDREVAEPDQPLEGTAWQLDGIVQSEALRSVPSGVQASLLITDGGTAEVDTGCNSGTTSVEIGDDTLTFAPMAVTLMLCEEDANSVQDAVLGTLDGEVTYQIDSDRLSIRRDDGSGLEYVAR